MGILQLFTLAFSFILYLVDLGTDVYVAIQHYKNGDPLFFITTVGVIGLSTVLVNIYAIRVLKMIPCYLRAILFVSHLSMICLFVSEIRRCVKENQGNEAQCGSSQKHFSKCDCNGCRSRLKESIETSLNVSFVRSMETFIEAVPQWLLQVYIMIDQQRYPWYAVTSVVLSFASLLFGVVSLEKNYWMYMIATEHPDHEANFSKKSAIVFCSLADTSLRRQAGGNFVLYPLQ